MLSGTRTFAIVLSLTAGLCLAQTKSETPAHAPGAATTKARIDLNRARADELKALPGIGDAEARKIVDGRPYQNPEQLVSKGVLSDAAYRRVKDLVVTKNAWRP
jgi:competence protein ComEA